MGSGGPRGLQILLSVADRGRGGFDSHTFPPIVALGLALVLPLMAALAPCARAQAPARPDTGAVRSVTADTSAAPAPAHADSAVARAAAPVKPARPMGERPRAWHATPFAIMARSAIVPGWGQAANKRWLKAGLAAGVEGWSGARFLKAWRDVHAADQRETDALASGDAAAAATAQLDYDAAFQRRASAGWLFGVAAVLSMLDAYVDAHFLQFDADFGPDPVLPDDIKGASSLRTAEPTLRVGVRVSIP